ncbi:MAG: Asp23/Gls24 family envelope stress response protein [Clostridia bacterium]|nr:Asp23/Gls24 family envelope stress response protein [Clostridia bacterium]
MIKLDNQKGTLIISDEVFANVVGYAATSCYGVAGMASRNTTDGIMSLIKKENLVKGVKVVCEDDELIIEMHIVVLYGINIPAITESIIHKVSYVVEDATGFKVRDIHVFVDYVKV